MADAPTVRGTLLGARFREAREYLGLTITQVAAVLGWEAADVERIEGAGGRITGEQLRKLSRLYHRPIAWFSGDLAFQPGADLLRQVEHLSNHDREAVLDFAEFLDGAGPAPAARRVLPGEDGDGASRS